MYEWFFVRRLPEDAQERTAGGATLQIQKLDVDGLAVGVVDLPGDADHGVILGTPVPAAVIDAARRQPVGSGDYVDRDGRTVPPF